MLALVHVLLPVKNAAPWLADALDDLLRQAGVVPRILVIDDGGDDGSRGIAHSMARRLPDSSGIAPSIRILDNDQQGIAWALETGRRAAMAEDARFIARMDGDDRCPAHRLHSQLEVLIGKDLGCVAAQSELFADDPADVTAGLQRWMDWQNGLLTHEQMALERFVDVPAVAGSCLFRAEALEQADGWRDERWMDDLDLWLRFFDAGLRVEKIPEPLYRWRRHPKQDTRTSRKGTSDNMRRGKARYLTRLLKRRGQDRIQLVGLPHSVPHWRRALLREAPELNLREVAWAPPRGWTPERTPPPPLDPDRVTLHISSSATIRDQLRALLPDWAASEGDRMWFVS